MDMLALIVFDEVHNCVKNSSGRKIMMNFYHQHKKAGMPVPSILGLTASPIISSKDTEITKLEVTMDAICVTPTIYRDELLKNVNKPHLVRVEYDITKVPARTSLMQQVQAEYASMDISKDPVVLKLKAEADQSEKHREKLMNVVMKHDTFSQIQIQRLWSKSRDILAELGSWAVDRYISQMIKSFLSRIDSPTTFVDTWSNEDRTYLAGHLRRININTVDNSAPTKQSLSHKASRLIGELLKAKRDTIGIIFVKERATTYALCELLTEYPRIRDRYRIGAMVGASSSGSSKQNLYEYSNAARSTVLDDFKSGAINLLVATDVLEEGIDVPACDLVVSFDEIKTLRSYIQRRGRARMRTSKMMLLQSSNADPRDWAALEEEMKSRYQDEQREQYEAERLVEQDRIDQLDSIYFNVQ
ncbi:hypothetical protein IL306_003334, partial [Fusarium sp. DS 682]